MSLAHLAARRPLRPVNEAQLSEDSPNLHGPDLNLPHVYVDGALLEDVHLLASVALLADEVAISVNPGKGEGEKHQREQGSVSEGQVGWWVGELTCVRERVVFVC